MLEDALERITNARDSSVTSLVGAQQLLCVVAVACTIFMIRAAAVRLITRVTDQGDNPSLGDHIGLTMTASESVHSVSWT